MWIDLGNHFIAKKLNPQNKDDIYIVNELSIDPCVSSYIELKNVFIDTSYLNHVGMYQSQYGIYFKENTAIGYLDISKIYETCIDTYVNLTYAILKEHRKKGFAKEIIREVTQQILLDKVECVNSVGYRLLLIIFQVLQLQRLQVL